MPSGNPTGELSTIVAGIPLVHCQCFATSEIYHSYTQHRENKFDSTVTLRLDTQFHDLSGGKLIPRAAAQSTFPARLQWR